jgi:two-component system response regulator FlrC
VAQKILVVEDDIIIRTNICDALKAAGYDATEARDGEEARELVINRRFDLVISDFVIPKIHGLKLVEFIRSKWPETPILLLTAYLSVDAAQIILQGAAEPVHKPVELDALVATVLRKLRPQPQS